jgi:hypothetical protein
MPTFKARIEADNPVAAIRAIEVWFDAPSIIDAAHAIEGQFLNVLGYDSQNVVKLIRLDEK